MKQNSVIGYKKGQMVTVGIPTCYGGDSLVETVRTLSQSEKVDKFRLIIVADRNPISKSNLKKLTDFGAEIYWNKKEGSQFKKLRQIVEMVESELFVFTNDDIVFETNTIAEIVKVFQQNPRATMVNAKILPLKPENLFEGIIGTSIRIVNNIGLHWHKSNNYLLANGRCSAFKTSFLKTARFPEVVNGDMFLYLENKRLGDFLSTPH